MNAAEPWVAELQKGIQNAPQVELVQAAPVELAARASDGIFYIESPTDQRVVFIIPRYV